MSYEAEAGTLRLPGTFGPFEVGENLAMRARGWLGSSRSDEVTLGFYGASGGAEQALSFRVLSSVRQRLCGLLGTKRGQETARPVALVDCGSVHTLGMAYGIDVALVDASGTVLAIWRGMRPGHVFGARGAVCALERPMSRAPWPKRGSRLSSPDGWSWSSGWSSRLGGAKWGR